MTSIIANRPYHKASFRIALVEIENPDEFGYQAVVVVDGTTLVVAETDRTFMGHTVILPPAESFSSIDDALEFINEEMN